MTISDAKSRDTISRYPARPSSKFSLSFFHRDILISFITKKTTFPKFECSAKRETILYKIESTLIVLLVSQLSSVLTNVHAQTINIFMLLFASKLTIRIKNTLL